MAYFVGITGASGSIIGIRLTEELTKIDKVYLAMTGIAKYVIKSEKVEIKENENLILIEEKNFLSPVSSGSNRLKATIIAPCSMGTLSRIANGISSNIIERAADIALKEKWPLILVPRETPLSTIHLENMLKLSKTGAVILPPVLTFYHDPNCIMDMVNFIVGRILDILNIEHKLYRRWQCDSKVEE
ncbi:MAG: UbiX family flavin prenyltransferase [Thermosulfidibacteraceae bacterium]|jgi:4-hydroxy-3-polyprenylbenzoate decarboxylase